MTARRKRRVIRYGLVFGNLALLLLVFTFVARTPSGSSSDGSQRTSSVALSEEREATGPRDRVSSADIAVNVARVVGLPETNSVTNHADSVNAAASTVDADSGVVAKPQVISSGLPSKDDIQFYTTKEGDTISSIAAKFGVSSDSVRWSNNLSGDSVAVGVKLVLPPAGVSGIVYTVQAGDTPASLAQKFNADKSLIISFNDAEISGLKPGERVIIPDGVLTATTAATTAVRTSYSSATNFAWGGNAPVYSANGYDYGWCTWHAANRRRETGRPIPSNLGNAISWYSIAASAGLPVGAEPRAGAVLWHANLGGLGHVGYVEKLNSDGSILVSDMNYPIWGSVTYRTVPAGEIGNYRFIY